MSDCSDLLLEFNKKIILSKTKQQSLKDSSKSLENKITKYFELDKKEATPSYYSQGSFAMGTIINPLDEEFDIDIGVHLNNLGKEKKEWPATSTVHSWIYDAIEGHSSEDPIDKNTCIRIIFQKEYHVDLPIYCEYEGEPYLADNGEKSWHISNPTKIIDWFKRALGKEGDQLRRIVQYLKAWKDNNSSEIKLPSGLVLTVLAVNNFQNNIREDVSLASTVSQIMDQIKSSSKISNPINCNENLSDKISKSQFDNFKSNLEGFRGNASEALKEKDKVEACKLWRKEFGERFDSCENLVDDDLELVTSAPALLRDDGRSADNGLD